MFRIYYSLLQMAVWLSRPLPRLSSDVQTDGETTDGSRVLNTGDRPSAEEAVGKRLARTTLGVDSRTSSGMTAEKQKTEKTRRQPN